MTFELSRNHLDLQARVRALATNGLAPKAVERANDEGFPFEAARLLAAEGLLGLTVGEKAGAGSVLDAVLAIEEVARACPGSADAVHQGNFGAVRHLARHGTAEQKRRFLDPILSGRAVMPVAITEEEAGVAVAELKTTATPDGDGVRLVGGKKFAAYSAEADRLLVYARFGTQPAEIGALIVERGMAGLTFGAPVRFTSGDRWAPLTFDRVAVPHANILFAAGGFTEYAAIFESERLGHAARALGTGWCAFDAARRHAMTRRQFGRPLCEFQGVQWKFAAARAQLDAAQLLLYRAAARADRGALAAEDAVIAKLSCNAAASLACDDAVQTTGATGYSEGSLVEYCFRKARGFALNGGTPELMKTRIAEVIFEQRFPQQPPHAGP